VAVSWRETLVVLAVSLAAVVAGMPLFLRAARRWGLLDRPNERSAHVGLTPRGGGLVLLLAVAAALGALVPWRGASPAVAWVVAGAVVLALAGLMDDRFHLPAAPRLVLHVATSALVVWGTGGGFSRLPLPEPLDLPLGALGPVLSVVWLVSVLNFYNFLDGIDGLAGAQGAVTGLGIALAAWDRMAALGGAALAGACLGFLAYNWSPARVFLGDAGSALLGFSFAAFPLLAPPARRPGAVFFVALSLWLFLADGTWTFARRLRRGEDVLRAHRQHVYQRLVDSGLGHGVGAAAPAAGAAALTALGLAAWRQGGPGPGWLGLLAALLLFGLEVLALRRRARGGAVRPGALGGGREAHVG
jgi:UDP-N-acetylmuramyl pentapeptide phosphotransferase/UDP-N-acetylglucosamine-1-phosphate transferase